MEKVVVLTPGGERGAAQTPGRDVWWHEEAARVSADCPAEAFDSEHPLFILYTSGSTGKPKGILHTTGGYLVGTYATTRYYFDLREDDVYWCTADVGWITGHSYVTYGPLANGATVVMYEGAPDTPDCGRWWKLIEEHKVTILYTAPTAIRSFIKWGDQLAPGVRSEQPAAPRARWASRLIPEAWMWYPGA